MCGVAAADFFFCFVFFFAIAHTIPPTHTLRAHPANSAIIFINDETIFYGQIINPMAMRSRRTNSKKYEKSIELMRDENVRCRRNILQSKYGATMRDGYETEEQREKKTNLEQNKLFNFVRVRSLCFFLLSVSLYLSLFPTLSLIYSFRIPKNHWTRHNFLLELFSFFFILSVRSSV